MIQVKIFDVREKGTQEKMNKFLQESGASIPDRGIEIKDGIALFVYDDRKDEKGNAAAGYNRDEQVLIIEALLKDVIKNRLGVELDYRLYTMKSLQKLPGAKMEAVLAAKDKAATEIEMYDEQIVNLRAIYADIKAGKLVI